MRIDDDIPGLVVILYEYAHEKIAKIIYAVIRKPLKAF